MTTTPEERAKAVWLECFDGKREAANPVDIIAQAIRDAEDDAIERAAKVCDLHKTIEYAFRDLREMQSGAWQENDSNGFLADEISGDIRALKHTKD